jgi:hypothetical protein
MSLPTKEQCGNHRDRFPCSTCGAPVPAKCLRYFVDYMGINPAMDASPSPVTTGDHYTANISAADRFTPPPASSELVERLTAELRKYATGNNRDDYGRGWNCAMEEAEAIVRRLTAHPVNATGDQELRHDLAMIGGEYAAKGLEHQAGAITKALDRLSSLSNEIRVLRRKYEDAVGSLWNIKELANGLGETLIENEARRLYNALGDARATLASTFHKEAS